MVRNYDPHAPRDSSAYERLNPGAVFAHVVKKPNYTASEDLFFAEVDGTIISYVNVLPELAIGRVVLDYQVEPNQSADHVLAKLLYNALQRAGELRAKVAHIRIASSQSAQAESLSNLEFKETRRYLELRLDLSKINLEAEARQEIAYCHLEPGEEEALAQIQNRCFSGSWGYNPNTTDDIIWQLKIKGNCPDDIILARDGDRLIGYCWIDTDYGQRVSTNRGNGQIYMLGVDPDFRGGGLGRRLLRAGLSHLRSKGQEIIDITVDNCNYSAVKLYYSEGFQLTEESLWYEKIIL